MIWSILLLAGSLWWLTHWMERIVVPALSQKWQRERDLEDRRLKVAEREIALKEDAAKRPDGSDAVLPPDLRDRVQSWEDAWAKEGEEANIRSLYAELRDWDAVRRMLQPLRTDDYMGEVS